MTDLPIVMTYFYRAEVIPSSNSFLWWNCLDYSASGLMIIVMAWGSIEQYLLVFHDSLMFTRRKRMIFHRFRMLLSVLIF
jgi:hypothetical protein